MRRLQSLLLAGSAAALLVTGFAHPSAATPTPFTSATLTTQFPGLPGVVLHAVTSISTVGLTGSAGGVNQLTLPATLFSTAHFVLDVTDPAAAPIAGLQLTEKNAAGTFTGVGANLGGKMPLVGVNKVCLFASCAAPPPANLVVPINVVGNAGAATVSTLVNITALGAPWTAGTAAVGTVKMTGFNHFTSASKFDVKLVTPIFVSTNIGASAVVPIFSILEIKNTPEPGIAVTCSVAIGTLLVMGRRRLRKP